MQDREAWTASVMVLNMVSSDARRCMAVLSDSVGKVQWKSEMVGKL